MCLSEQSLIDGGQFGYNDDRFFFEVAGCDVSLCDAVATAREIGGQGHDKHVIFVQFVHDQYRSAFGLAEIGIGHMNIIDRAYH